MHAVRPVLPNRNHVSFVRVRKIGNKKNKKKIINPWWATDPRLSKAQIEVPKKSMLRKSDTESDNADDV